MKSATNMTRKPNKSVADADVLLLAGLLDVGEADELCSELGLGRVEDMAVYTGRGSGEKRIQKTAQVSTREPNTLLSSFFRVGSPAAPTSWIGPFEYR
jgi:hypothetical protein